MQALGELIHKKKKYQKEKITGLNKLSKPVSLPRTLVVEFGDLINPRFQDWYAKQARLLGLDRFRILAAIARQEGKDPAKYFSWLIKNHDRAFMQALPQTGPARIQA